VTDSPKDHEKVQFSLDAAILNPKIVYANTDDEIIVVNKDRLRLCLEVNIERAVRRDRWLVPLTTLVPILLAMATGTFAHKFGFDEDAWEAICILLIIADLFWLFFEVRRRGKRVTAEQIVADLAKNPIQVSSTHGLDEARQDQISAIGSSITHAPPFSEEGNTTEEEEVSEPSAAESTSSSSSGHILLGADRQVGNRSADIIGPMETTEPISMHIAGQKVLALANRIQRSRREGTRGLRLSTLT
jgi:hypothetical protein